MRVVFAQVVFEQRCSSSLLIATEALPAGLVALLCGACGRPRANRPTCSRRGPEERAQEA